MTRTLARVLLPTLLVATFTACIFPMPESACLYDGDDGQYCVTDWGKASVDECLEAGGTPGDGHCYDLGFTASCVGDDFPSDASCPEDADTDASGDTDTGS